MLFNIISANHTKFTTVVQQTVWRPDEFEDQGSRPGQREKRETQIYRWRCFNFSFNKISMNQTKKIFHFKSPDRL